MNPLHQIGNVRRWCFAGGVAMLLALAAAPAGATSVALVGLYGGKALVVIDGGPPLPVLVGVPTPDGVKLLAIDGQSADFEVDGRRQRLTIGQQSVSAGRDTDASNTITLTADPSGHFFASGTVNGAPMRFIVDTGASTVALGKSDAIRANVDYQNGQLGAVMTASGLARVWRVKLNSVRVGTVILSNIEATVHENDLPIALLGMSFLNRMEMKRDGVTMVLKKRY